MLINRKFFPERTKVIFFDLEYYVPLSDRNRPTPSGMRFSPVMNGHKLLGGSFLTYFPMQNQVGKKCSFWEWKMGDECGVLHAIYGHLKEEWRSFSHPQQDGALMLSGIGISHSDIPCLMARMNAYEIDEARVIYDTIYGCRQLDLSVATFCQFSFNNSYFSYPKTKSQLYQKYANGKQMESGKSVWDLYENEDYSAIENRCFEEVEDCLSIYKVMFDIKKNQDNDLKKLKRLDKSSRLDDAKSGA